MSYYLMYLRKSRADLDAEARGEGETLARHRAMLEGVAGRNGHAILKVFAEVVSGETIAARPAMQQLLAAIADPDCAGVYVMEVERLARGDTVDQGRVAQAFLYSGTRIITPSKTYDPHNEFDLEYFEFGLFMSRREYKTINRRIQAGRQQSVKEGKYICSRPAYGYRKQKLSSGKGYTLCIVQEEAQVVRNVFAWYASGAMGMRAISSHLTDLATPPGTQGTGWAPCRVQRMLTNEVYIGMIRWGKTRLVRELSPDGITATRKYAKEGIELYKGLHEPIISQDLWDAVQQRLGTATIPMRRDMAQSNPLVGIVFCARCGHAMRGQTAAGRQHAQLLCANHACAQIRTARPPVEAAILSTLRAWVDDFSVALDPFRHLEQGDTAQCDRIKQRIQSYQRDIDLLQTQKSSLHDLLERGVYTVQVFQQRLADIQTRLHDATQRLAHALDHLPAAPPLYEPIETLAPRILNVLDLYPGAAPGKQCELLLSVLSRVTYDKQTRGLGRGANPHQFTLEVFPAIRR